MNKQKRTDKYKAKQRKESAKNLVKDRARHKKEAKLRESEKRHAEFLKSEERKQKNFTVTPEDKLSKASILREFKKQLMEEMKQEWAEKSENIEVKIEE